MRIANTVIRMTDIPDPRITPTLAPEEAGRLLDSGRTATYAEIAATGQLAGVPVIRVGKKIRVPTAPLLARLGLDQNPANTGSTS